MPPLDPNLVDFVKALARANAARDIARLKEGRCDGQKDSYPSRRSA